MILEFILCRIFFAYFRPVIQYKNYDYLFSLPKNSILKYLCYNMFMLSKLKLTDWSLIILLILISIGFYKVIHFFIADIFLALILTRLFWGSFQKMTYKFNLNKSLSSFICVLIAFILIVSPLFLTGMSVSNDMMAVYETIKRKLPLLQELVSSHIFLSLFNKFPFLKNYIDAINQPEMQSQIYQTFSTVAKISYTIIEKTFVNVSLVIFHLAIILILMYFLLQDSGKLAKKVYSLVPLEKEEKLELYREILNITDATLVGVIVVGLIEGVFGGLLFALFGIPNAALWGVVMTIFSILPMIGINSVVFPMSVVLIFSGRWLVGISLVLLAYIGTTITQMYIKPYLVGLKSGLHPAIVLLSSIGGIIWLGLPGFVIGPVIAALFIAIWNQFDRHFKNDLA